MVPAAAKGTLHGWCYAAGVPPRNALAFTRLLRVVQIAARTGGDPADYLDISGVRTLGPLLARAGFGRPRDLRAMTLSEFCHRQRLVVNHPVLREVQVLLHRSRQP